MSASVTLVSVLAGIVLGAVLDLSDTAAAAISVLACVAALAWGLSGARQLPPLAGTMVLGFACSFGFVLRMTAGDRHPPLHPVLLAIAVTVIFVAAGSALTWPVLGGARLRPAGAVADPNRRNAVLAGLVYLLFGLTFAQTGLILVNVGAEPRPVQVFPGTVTQRYRTHGRGAADHLVLSGPAAAFGAMLNPGDFEVTQPQYDATEIGARLCLTIHTGRLRLRWWTMAPC